MGKFCCIILFVGVNICFAWAFAKVEPKLEARLASREHVSVFVSFVGGTTNAIKYVNSRSIVDREERLNTLHSSLVDNAKKSQADVLQMLTANPEVDHKSFWITNQIYIKDAPARIVFAIAQDPQVESITEEVMGYLIRSVDESGSDEQEDGKWAIDKIQAKEAWATIGSDGTGVVVGTIATGVRLTHEALKDNYVGQYGWFDPGNGTLEPNDIDGHGTHVTGLVAGSHGIGVAPGAKSMCRMCSTDDCFQSEFVACGQFFACPTLANGTSPNCSMAPHVVANSWGYLGEAAINATWFDDILAAWHAGGVIPVFAVGNGGSLSECSNTGYPADIDVIAVGATEYNDAIYNYSSRGPSPKGVIKPDITAPGINILSASFDSDDGYVIKSGTAFSCPLVAGVVALLQSGAGNHTLTYQEIRDRLMGKADRNLTFSGYTCGNISDNLFPNNVFGYGRVNALKSVQATLLYSNLNSTKF